MARLLSEGGERVASILKECGQSAERGRERVTPENMPRVPRVLSKGESGRAESERGAKLAEMLRKVGQIAEDGQSA